VIYIWR